MHLIDFDALDGGHLVYVNPDLVLGVEAVDGGTAIHLPGWTVRVRLDAEAVAASLMVHSQSPPPEYREIRQAHTMRVLAAAARNKPTE